MKDLKISKELIKNVFNYDIDGFQIVGTDKSTQLRVWKKGCEFHLYDSLDIHHFAFKCKEWAFSKGYIISSGLTPVLGVNKDGWAEVFSSSTPLDGKLRTFKQLSESEAVFRACEWILKGAKQ